MKHYQFLTIIGLLMGILAMTGQNLKTGIMLYILFMGIVCILGAMIAFIANK